MLSTCAACRRPTWAENPLLFDRPMAPVRDRFRCSLSQGNRIRLSGASWCSLRLLSRNAPVVADPVGVRAVAQEAVPAVGAVVAPAGRVAEPVPGVAVVRAVPAE